MTGGDGQPDWQTGLYIGTDLPASDERVRKRVPLHGPNLLPGSGGTRRRRPADVGRRPPGDDVAPGLRRAIDEYMRVRARARRPAGAADDDDDARARAWRTGDSK